MIFCRNSVEGFSPADRCSGKRSDLVAEMAVRNPEIRRSLFAFAPSASPHRSGIMGLTEYAAHRNKSGNGLAEERNITRRNSFVWRSRTGNSRSESFTSPGNPIRCICPLAGKNISGNHCSRNAQNALHMARLPSCRYRISPQDYLQRKPVVRNWKRWPGEFRTDLTELSPSGPSGISAMQMET